MTTSAGTQGKGQYAIVDDRALVSSDTLIDRLLATFRGPNYSHHRVQARGKDNVLAAAVCIADWIASELGYVMPGEASAAPREAMEALKLSDVTFADIKMQARGVVARIE